MSWAVVSSGGKYDSRSRVVIRQLSWKLPLKLEDLEEVEGNLLQMLTENTDEEKT